MPPRSNRMPIDQDWTSVWPAASTFKASVVPLPIRMGWDTKDGSTPPSKYGNAELMKIPNFLHLTPLHIKKHCEAIKKFCTEWPTNLTTSKAMEKHFPVEVKYSDFCYSSPSIREPQSRIVTLSVKLSSLELDYHARDKLLRLVGDQYNAKTDTLTIFADRCPTRKQNYDYVQYLLTAIYHESWKTEPWEHEKEESDWEVYFWEKSISKKNVLELLRRLEPEATTVEILERPDVHTYCKSVQELHDDGEDLSTLSNYKLAVKKLLALS
ncbi:PREDICTED: 28S ribosomal protein S35, mitochondrial-like [Priapulus caudatus]|uniref:28S ribosomal protein S35, mitochondrial-like n=1 Tax=Priapulus caudatus TaxID=37621 RepID=A0ABM1EX26_PRICU|nr:PREDICTED: 28S ribosomal protein S35, mitochondrial-like [Priapulus caudatus]